MLVGTAMTGTPTRPPTTLGRAPSMPAQTTTISAVRTDGELRQQSMQSRHANIVETRYLCPEQVRGKCSLLGNGQVTGTRAQDGDVPVLADGFPWGEASQVIQRAAE